MGSGIRQARTRRRPGPRSVVGRHLIARAAGLTLFGLLAFWPFLLLGTVDHALSRTSPLLGVAPGLMFTVGLVLSAPLVFGLAASAGVSLLQLELDRSGEALALGLHGTSPRWIAALSLAPAAGLSALALVLLYDVQPRAMSNLYGRTWLDASVLDELLVRLDELPAFGHVAYSGSPRAAGRIEDLRLFVVPGEEDALLIAADDARLEIESERELKWTLEHGLIGVGAEHVREVRFERAEMVVDLDALIRVGRRDWVAPSERSLTQLRQDARLAAEVVGDGARRMERRYAFEPWWRLAIGLLPLAGAAQVLLALGCLTALTRRPLDVLIAFVGVSELLACVMAAAKSVSKVDLGLGLALLPVALTLLWIPVRAVLRFLARHR